jgi:hypothetical protein
MPTTRDRKDSRRSGVNERLETAAAIEDAKAEYVSGRLDSFVRESNRIEGIHRDPTPEEIQAHEELLALDTVTVEDLECFVGRIQPGAELRRRPGMNVRVGAHLPPLGHPKIERELTGLLTAISNAVNGQIERTPWQAHVEYETLHPFQDGNGRSGRALWAWQMLQEGRDPFALPILQHFYYDALDWGRGQL